MTQLKLFSEFELPFAVRPHRFLNFEEARWTRIAAELAALRREHMALCEQFLREASVAEFRSHWPKMQEVHRRFNETELEIVAELLTIEGDRNAYVEQMLSKIRDEP